MSTHMQGRGREVTRHYEASNCTEDVSTHTDGTWSEDQQDYPGQTSPETSLYTEEEKNTSC